MPGSKGVGIQPALMGLKVLQHSSISDISHIIRVRCCQFMIHAQWSSNDCPCWLSVAVELIKKAERHRKTKDQLAFTLFLGVTPLVDEEKIWDLFLNSEDLNRSEQIQNDQTGKRGASACTAPVGTVRHLRRSNLGPGALFETSSEKWKKMMPSSLFIHFIQHNSTIFLVSSTFHKSRGYRVLLVDILGWEHTNQVPAGQY